ncbi:MAG: phosphoglycolate phosphatase [Acetobacteraceae bacterium]
MPRVLLLDLDGTLVDTVPDLAAALNRMLAVRDLPPLSHAETTPMVGDGVARLVERAFAARGRVPDAKALSEFAADYAAHASVESRLYPAVPETLRAMSAEGWRMAVCTNKPEGAARSLLEALGLMPFMTAVGGGDSFPVRKPDPAHMLATLEAAGGRADRAVMIGDHANDVTAAKGAGLPCIFAAWGYGPPVMAEGAAAVAQDMAEMAAIARRLVPA